MTGAQYRLCKICSHGGYLVGIVLLNMKKSWVDAQGLWVLSVFMGLSCLPSPPCKSRDAKACWYWYFQVCACIMWNKSVMLFEADFMKYYTFTSYMLYEVALSLFITCCVLVHVCAHLFLPTFAWPNLQHKLPGQQHKLPFTYPISLIAHHFLTVLFQHAAQQHCVI